MSRITGTDAYNLMEAYNNVYAPQELTEEQVWEEVENWVNSLLEEGYDLSEYTWEEMFEAYLSEAPISPIFNTKAFGDFYRGKETEKGLERTFRAGGGQAALAKGRTPLDIMRQGSINLKPSAARTPATRTPAATPAARTPAATPAARTPAGTPPGGKVAPIKPAAAAQTGDKTADMATWAKANPKLAAAAAERARTRGTSATTNPLMKDMKSRLPAPTSTPSPAPTSTTSGQTGTTTPKPAASPTTGGSQTPQLSARAQALNAGGPQGSPSDRLKRYGISPIPTTGGSQARQAAQTPKPTTPAPARPMGSARERVLRQSFDPFDVIKGHLIDEGYADTEEAALKIMVNMSEEWRRSIVEQDLTARQEYLMKKVGDMNAAKSGSAHTATPGKQSAGAALDRANRSAMQVRGV